MLKRERERERLVTARVFLCNNKTGKSISDFKTVLHVILSCVIACTDILEKKEQFNYVLLFFSILRVILVFHNYSNNKLHWIVDTVLKKTYHYI